MSWNYWHLTTFHTITSGKRCDDKQTVQAWERWRTDRQTDGRTDATKRIISPASRSIINPVLELKISSIKQFSAESYLTNISGIYFQDTVLPIPRTPQYYIMTLLRQNYFLRVQWLVLSSRWILFTTGMQGLRGNSRGAPLLRGALSHLYKEALLLREKAPNGDYLYTVSRGGRSEVLD